MSPLAWKDQYNIGHYQIDNEHKKLIALANKVMDFSNNGEDKDKINKVLNALSDYVKIHFRNEEKYFDCFSKEFKNTDGTAPALTKTMGSMGQK
jgi:hemerythrin-like metal-binding protein